jgi:hypothetical protein
MVVVFICVFLIFSAVTCNIVSEVKGKPAHRNKVNKPSVVDREEKHARQKAIAESMKKSHLEFVDNIRKAANAL